MADKKKENLPKVPPFIIPGASNNYAEESQAQSGHIVPVTRPPVKNDRYLSRFGLFSFLSLVIGVVSLFVAMVSGAWFAYGFLGRDNQAAAQTAQPPYVIPFDPSTGGNDPSEVGDSSIDIISKIIVVGLAYLVGWIFSVFGVRILGNLILPYAVQVYTWVVLGGIIILQILIMGRLYEQEYHFTNYVKYLSLFGAGMLALIGLHLILEKHNLVPFGVLILLTSLGHLYTIVYHYIFVTDVNYKMLWGDLIFFFVTSIVSILMLAHFGLLNGMRNLIGHMFNPKTNKFVRLG